MSTIEREVRERLGDLRLDSAAREEVFAEIAAHLEYVAEELKAEGVDEDEVLRRSLSQLNDVRTLMKGIQRAKESAMRDSFRKVWLPGAVVVLLVYWSQMVIYRFIPEPRTYHILGTYYAYSLGWLITETFAGALGAWWCREVGGSVRDRLIVALAPAEAMAVVIALCLPLDAFMQLVFEHRVPYFVSHPMMTLAMALWILHPAVPCLIGAAAFLSGGKRPKEPEVTQLPA